MIFYGNCTGRVRRVIWRFGELSCCKCCCRREGLGACEFEFHERALLLVWLGERPRLASPISPTAVVRSTTAIKRLKVSQESKYGGEGGVEDFTPSQVAGCNNSLSSLLESDKSRILVECETCQTPRFLFISFHGLFRILLELHCPFLKLVNRSFAFPFLFCL